MKSIIQEV